MQHPAAAAAAPQDFEVRVSKLQVSQKLAEGRASTASQQLAEAR